MSSKDGEPKTVGVSQKGQATIPKELRERVGIEPGGDVLVYEEEGRIIIEPLPSLEQLHGIHAGEREPGEVLANVREWDREDRERDEAEVAALVERHSEDSDESDGDDGGGM